MAAASLAVSPCNKAFAYATSLECEGKSLITLEERVEEACNSTGKGVNLRPEIRMITDQLLEYAFHTGSTAAAKYGRAIRIQQHVNPLLPYQHCGFKVWQSVWYLEENIPLCNKRVVEIGSGTGLGGCVAAAMGASVTLTEYNNAEYLSVLQANVNLNFSVEQQAKQAIQVRPLSWGELDAAANVATLKLDDIDFVIGSDLIYEEDTASMLVTTLVELCPTSNVQVLMGLDDHREFFAENLLCDFFAAAQKYFDISTLQQDHGVIIVSMRRHAVDAVVQSVKLAVAMG